MISPETKPVPEEEIEKIEREITTPAEKSQEIKKLMNKIASGEIQPNSAEEVALRKDYNIDQEVSLDTAASAFDIESDISQAMSTSESTKESFEKAGLTEGTSYAETMMTVEKYDILQDTAPDSIAKYEKKLAKQASKELDAMNKVYYDLVAGKTSKPKKIGQKRGTESQKQFRAE